jgi:hypothetical protein
VFSVKNMSDPRLENSRHYLHGAMTKLTALVALTLMAAAASGGCGGDVNNPRDGARDSLQADIRPADTAVTPDTATPDGAVDHAVTPDGGAVDLGGGMTVSDGPIDVASLGDTRAADEPLSPDAAIDAPPPLPDAPLPPPDMEVDAPPPPPDAPPPPPDAPPPPPDMAVMMMPDAPPSPDVAPGGEMFVGNLRGGEVVPDQVDTAATGTITVSLDPNGMAIAYHLTHTVTGATSAALHLASAGESAPVEIPMAPLSADITGTAAVSGAQVAELRAGRFYASVSSAGHPDGEIRGQLLRPGEREYVGHLTGSQETPPNNSSFEGHTTFIIDAAATQVSYRRAAPAAIFDGSVDSFSNVHFGPPGILSHSIVFGLDPLTPVMTGSEASDAASLANLRRGLWSVDIHSAAYHDGEIRGTLVELGETLYSTALDGEEVVPPVTTTATAGMGIILDAAHANIRFDAMVMDVTPTAAFVKRGAVGTNGTTLFPLTVIGMNITGDRPVTAQEISDLNAGLWYVEIQSAAHPGGELRGQFERR